MRPTRIQTYMECAQAWAKRSTCHRLNVGAVIVVDRTIVSHGYNGVPSGHEHCLGNACPGKFECKETIHAEVNALRRWSVEGPTPAADMYCTDSPCPDCATNIVVRGIRRVFFATPYRITTSLDGLMEAGVEVYRVTPAGYVINWKTRDVVEPVV